MLGPGFRPQYHTDAWREGPVDDLGGGGITKESGNLRMEFDSEPLCWLVSKPSRRE